MIIIRLPLIEYGVCPFTAERCTVTTDDLGMPAGGSFKYYPETSRALGFRSTV